MNGERSESMVVEVGGGENLWSPTPKDKSSREQMRGRIMWVLR